MSDAYSLPSFFSSDTRGGALTYEQLQARRKIAMALATRNRPFPKTIGEGLTYLGESLGEGYADRRAASDEANYRRQSAAEIQRLTTPDSAPAPATPAAPATPNAGLGPMSPDIDPVGGAVGLATPGAVEREQGPVQQGSPRVAALAQPERGPIAEATATRQPLTTQQAGQQPSMSIEEWKKRIARNESSIWKDPYSGVGERSRKGDYPYGKYQVMGANIPKWTQAYLGRKMTPTEFLADPEAQEQLASARGGEYMTKYGPIGAAQAWFGGENWRKDPRATDTLGTHVAEYTRRFNIPLVERDQVVASAAKRAAPPSATALVPEEPPLVQMASLSAPTPDTTPDPREAIVQQLTQAQSPMQPQPAPQQQPLSPQSPTQRAPIGTPVPTRVSPPAGPPPAPEPQPMSQREMEIRRRIGSTTDENFKGQLQPIVDQMEAQRKFEDARRIKQWEIDLTTYKERTDPVRQEQLQKSQEERAAKERERIKVEQRGGVPQAVLDKQVEESGKATRPLREASVAINQVENLLNQGMFTGLTGKLDLVIAKAKMAMGGAVDPRVQATETFTASIKPIVAAARAALAGGANISDRDMMAAEAAAGGDITLTEQGIRDIMKSVREVQLQTAIHHQKILATASGGDTAAERTLYGLHGLPMEDIIPKNHKDVKKLMENPDNEHWRGLFDKTWNTPGLAEKIIAKQRRPQ